jgi:hypothetical protein
LLLVSGILLARKYGLIPAYIGFAWLIPVTSVVWLKGEGVLGFGESLLNMPFVLTVIAASFVLSAICFPMILISNKASLSLIRVIGLSLGALLHGVPFLLYIFIYLFVIFFGK